MVLLRWITSPFRYGLAVLKRKIGKLGLVRMELFLAFGNEKEIFIKGRIVEAYRQSRPSENKNAFQNIIAAIRRYAGSSIPDVRVMLEYHHLRIEMVSDEEGIFEKRFDDPHPVTNNKEKARLNIIKEPGIQPENEWIEIDILRYASDHDFGIISDIDDTIVVSHATKVGKKFWLSVSKNAYTRRPFPGVSEFYHLISEGGAHPVFYVSSSDWNLYDLIMDFLRYRNIPSGPILLKDLHVNLRNIWQSGGGDHGHKLDKICLLMSLYKEMKFVLVGDSGQHDPELYSEVIQKFRGRVIAVYIRRIDREDKEREKILNRYQPEVQVAWVKNTKEAIQHATQFLLSKKQ
ncbi:phosphatase domain-containing protein [Negadavirga shengliensis]|uniref:Phosphatase domain-containing protein n=1 Tax=Negadavirga shengliensis TaxID=1389218 RepID=A0ABV9T391_9BACT